MIVQDERRLLVHHRLETLTADQKKQYHDLYPTRAAHAEEANGHKPLSTSQQTAVMDWLITQIQLGKPIDDRGPIIYQGDFDANEVEQVKRTLRIRSEAKRQHDAESTPQLLAEPELVALNLLLEEEDDDAAYRIQELLPTGANVILAAQYKSGKSTLVGNLIRSLVDGQDFLGRFPVQRVEEERAGLGGRVLLIDNELDERTLRRWLRDQDITNTENVDVLSLRGKLSAFNIMDPDIRAQWVRKIEGSHVVILDCLRPLLDALGLDENLEAGQFLIAWDQLLTEALVQESVIVHHMGHAGERQRGSSRLLDWPDATWKIVREDPADPASPRYFSAFGRDVDVQEGRLEFEPSTRHLHLVGGDRKASRMDSAVDAVAAVLDLAPSKTLSRNAVVKELAKPENGGWPRRTVFDALDRLHNAGRTVTYTGARNAQMNTLKEPGRDLGASPFASPAPTLPVFQTSPGKQESTSPPSPIRGEGGGPEWESTNPANSHACPIHGTAAKPMACYTCAQLQAPPFLAADAAPRG